MDLSLDQAPCGFLVFDDDGYIVAANETLSRMLGYDCSALPGQHVQVLFSPGGRVFCQTHFLPLLKLQGEVEEIYSGCARRAARKFLF